MYKGMKTMLREVRDSDLPDIMKYVNDYDVYSSFTDSVPLPKSEAFQKKWINNSTNINIITFAIETLDTHEFIGTCQLRGIDMINASSMLSIIIGNASVHGKGYGTDALHTLLNFGFKHLNLNRISLLVYEDNPGAIRLYEKSGFVREGTLLKEVYRDGRYCDQHSYGILRSEFLKNEVKNG